MQLTTLRHHYRPPGCVRCISILELCRTNHRDGPLRDGTWHHKTFVWYLRAGSVTKDHKPLTPGGGNSRLVREGAPVIRAKSIETQLQTALSLCIVAEFDIELGRASRALAVLCRTSAAANRINAHLNVPGYVPENCIAGLRGQLEAVQSRIIEVRRRINQPTQL